MLEYRTLAELKGSLDVHRQGMEAARAAKALGTTFRPMIKDRRPAPRTVTSIEEIDESIAGPLPRCLSLKKGQAPQPPRKKT